MSKLDFIGIYSDFICRTLFTMFGLYIHIYALPFFKMDSSSECGTPNWTFLIIETVSDPVIEIKKADTTTKCSIVNGPLRIIVRDCLKRKF